MFKDLIHGATYIRRGFILLKHPELLIFLIIPAAIAMITFGLLTWISLTYSAKFSLWIINLFPEWLFSIVLWTIELLPLWLISALKLLIWLSYAFLFGLTFTTFTLFFASPFFGLLAHKTEKILAGRELVSNDSYLTTLLSLPKSIFRELSKLMYHLKLIVGVLLISFIPLLNSLTPFLWLLLSAWMMYIHFLDYPMDNHGHDIHRVKLFGRSKLFLSLGFGGSISILAAIPLINILTIPSAVIGATVLWYENAKDMINSTDLEEDENN